MSVDLRKSNCPTCANQMFHSASVPVDVVAATNLLSALLQCQLSLRDLHDCVSIHLARPTVNSRALVAMAGAQLRQAVAEIPEV